MKILKKVDFSEVLKDFDKEHPRDRGSNDWAWQRLHDANQKFNGIWHKVRLSRKDVLNILLVWHKDKDLELIPQTGLSVLEAGERFQTIKDEYREQNKDCYDKIMRFSQDVFSLVFLSAEPIKGFGVPEYEYLQYKSKYLVHLDGLHRLIAWEIAGRFGLLKYYLTREKLEAYVAGIVSK